MEFEKCYREASLRIESMARWLSHATEGKFWLDLGCGTGTVLGTALQFFEDGAGIDISWGMLREARKRELTVRMAEITAVPYPDECADVVSAYSVLHHLYNPARDLQEMIRLVKPGGFIYTDWDSNCRALYHSRILKSIWTLRRFLRARNGLEPLVRDQSAELQQLFRWAEFHHDVRGGLDAESLAEHLRASGCVDVMVFYYDGNPSCLATHQMGEFGSKEYKKAFLRTILTGRRPSLKRRDLCHRFAILARRAW